MLCRHFNSILGYTGKIKHISCSYSGFVFALLTGYLHVFVQRTVAAALQNLCAWTFPFCAPKKRSPSCASDLMGSCLSLLLRDVCYFQQKNGGAAELEKLQAEHARCSQQIQQKQQQLETLMKQLEQQAEEILTTKWAIIQLVKINFFAILLVSCLIYTYWLIFLPQAVHKLQPIGNEHWKSR